jgi:hypothetical protein
MKLNTKIQWWTKKEISKLCIIGHFGKARNLEKWKILTIFSYDDVNVTWGAHVS